jgi:putative ABC transport system permease protein
MGEPWEMNNGGNGADGAPAVREVAVMSAFDHRAPVPGFKGDAGRVQEIRAMTEAGRFTATASRSGTPARGASCTVPPMNEDRRPLSSGRLAWRQLRRDLAAGDLRLILWAVVLAVAALSAVGFFADRMRAGLWRDAAQLLGGDVVVLGDHELAPAFEATARARGLASGRAAMFPSMARAADAQGGGARLASVKAVDANYPVRGAVTIRTSEAAAPQAVHRPPSPGTAWIEPALAHALGVHVGDPVLLGDATLTVAALIDLEPDRGTGFSALAPRLMLNLSDLPSTGLVQPTSRISWRLAVAAGTGRDTEGYAHWANAEIKRTQVRGVRVETLASGRPEMRQTLDRAERFLSLVALMTALLAAVALAVAARDFAQSRLDACAMLRVLGQTQRRIATQHAIEFVVLGVLASLGGVALGFLIHLGFVAMLGHWLPGDLPWPGPRPALFGLGVGLTLLLGFGLPPVLQLARVPPLRVLRRDVGTPKAASAGVLVGGLLGFAVLLVAASRDIKLGLLSVGGFAAAAGVFALVGWAGVVLLRRAVPESRAPRGVVLATRAIAARPAFAVLQVASMALGLMALWLLVLLRTDLIDSWRASTPPDAPDRFVINIQPDQAEAFRAMLVAAHVTDFDWFPMARGRLMSIDGQPVGERYRGNPEARHQIEREFNLSHSLVLPRENTIVAGQWTPGEEGGASVEDGLAKQLGLKLGDTLVFDVAGQGVTTRITSLRKVDWGSMRVNFFVLFPRASLGDLPVSYISAFRAPRPPAQAGFDNALAARFPTITAIDVSQTIAQLQAIVDQVIRAVELLFGFALVAGLVVLVATINATREARAREFAVMRAVGASARLLGQVQEAELAGIGALAGGLAAAAALGVGWALARWVFEFQWNPPWWVPAAGAASGAVLALAAGWWSLREVLRRPVVETLRQAPE